MLNEGNEAAELRQSAPRRVTLQGRTFGKLALGTPLGSREQDIVARESQQLEARKSGMHRSTGARRSVG